ncbi:MAG TPA: hypothetical protein VGI70_21100 [Polyangiales bacterium]
MLVCSIGCARRENSNASPVVVVDVPSRAEKKPRVEITVIATSEEATARTSDDAPDPVAKARVAWQPRSACHAAACENLVLSAGGDEADGGEALARSMQTLGYAASIFGRPLLSRAGIPALGARSDPPLVVERAGIKLEVIGLTEHSLSAADDALPTLRSRVLALRAHGADAGILLTDICAPALADLLHRGARDLAFLVLAIGRTCHAKDWDHQIDSVTLVAAGRGFPEAARATLTFDRNTAALLRADVAPR